MSEPTPLTGEPLALDLVNTRTLDADLLSTPTQLTDWLAVQSPPFKIENPDLIGVRRLRAHIAAALDRVRAGAEPAPDDLAAINAAQRAAAPITELGWNGTAVTATRRRTGPATEVLLAWLAEAAAGLLADPAVTKVKQCEADDCVLLFLPANPRRRWCSPERCGNRVRVARHYQRHR